jgi:hypothetical protein
LVLHETPGLPLVPPTRTRSRCSGRSSARAGSPEIPAKESKRLIVLERIAIEFEPGRRYSEQEVIVVVGRFFTDHAALRRYLVDAGLLERGSGQYWRAGGRFDL